ncbi:hypothetical protein [Tenacibaculum xiamenense]|uniref:hypothetical protein n=1 Tax=Tenacibaculum xiamenense TaxID=1261553 RepID=UPI00389306E4
MKNRTLIISVLLGITLINSSCKAQQATNSIIKTNKSIANNDSKRSQLDGASVLAFGPNDILFVGDSKSGTIYAISTAAKTLEKPIPFNEKGIDKQIAKVLGVPRSEVIIADMQIHPTSQEAYIAVKRGNSLEAKSYILAISPESKDIRFVDVSNRTQIKINNIRTESFNFYRDRPANTLNITDIDYHEGYIYVAGLTNGEFASTLRKIAYPFTNKQEAVSGIEMYHAVHDQNETRAPIRTMAIENINGKSTLIASYTCTPLVSIPVSDIKKDNHIKAKTIAELGYGNTPIDMITFMAQEQDGSFDKKLLIINKERSASLISLKDFANAEKGKGLSSFSMGPNGVAIFPVPMAGVMQVSEQNQMMLTVLRRNIENGQIDLLSKVKGAYFRLSDFDSEYEFPDHTYRDGEPWINYHNMMKPMEGFPELIKQK